MFLSPAMTDAMMLVPTLAEKRPGIYETEIQFFEKRRKVADESFYLQKFGGASFEASMSAVEAHKADRAKFDALAMDISDMEDIVGGLVPKRRFKKVLLRF